MRDIHVKSWNELLDEVFAGSWMEPLYPLARGRYRSPDGATELFVSAGLGHWLPFRVNCPPEVVLITLVPA